jgi:hypothetical protein
MGYRSEVVAGVPLKDKKKALAIIKEWDAVGTGMLDRFWDKNPDGTIKKPLPYFYMQADYWKWYNSYDEVDKFEKFILADNDRFLTCLGEDGAHHTNYGNSTDHDIYVMSTLAVEANIKWDKTKRP